MKQRTLTLAAIATFCCSTLLQAQTLDQFIDLDLDEAHRGWVEVRRRMNGVWWSTQVPCDDVPEGMWSLEATQMVELGVLANGWEAVEVRLDWELPMKQENSPDGWVSVEAVGMSFPLPVNR